MVSRNITQGATSFNFTIRLHQGQNTSLADLTDITIAGITILKKRVKHEKPFIVDYNCNKFGFSANIIGKVFNSGGSHNYPCISFKGDYLDIEVKNFPRYPAFYQNYYAAKGCLQGYGYTNYVNRGFPDWLKYRVLEIL